MAMGHRAQTTQTPVFKKKKKSPKTKAQIAMRYRWESVGIDRGGVVLRKKQNQGSVPGDPRHAIFSGGMSTRNKARGLAAGFPGVTDAAQGAMMYLFGTRWNCNVWKAISTVA